MHWVLFIEVFVTVTRWIVIQPFIRHANCHLFICMFHSTLSLFPHCFPFSLFVSCWLTFCWWPGSVVSSLAVMTLIFAISLIVHGCSFPSYCLVCYIFVFESLLILACTYHVVVFQCFDLGLILSLVFSRRVANTIPHRSLSFIACRSFTSVHLTKTFLSRYFKVSNQAIITSLK